MTDQTPNQPPTRTWRTRLADTITRGRHAHLEHEVRRLTVERDLTAADLTAARRSLEGDPDRHAHVTLGAVLHRAVVRRDGMATIRVPDNLYEHWLAEHALTSTARAARLADVPMPEVEPGPGDRTALPPNPSYAGVTP